MKDRSFKSSFKFQWRLFDYFTVYKNGTHWDSKLYHLTASNVPLIKQGCQFSDLSLISDFLRIKETDIKLIKYSQNMDKISIVSKDRLDNWKGLDNPSLNTVSTLLNQFRLSSD